MTVSEKLAYLKLQGNDCDEDLYVLFEATMTDSKTNIANYHYFYACVGVDLDGDEECVYILDGEKHGLGELNEIYSNKSRLGRYCKCNARALIVNTVRTFDTVDDIVAYEIAKSHTW